MRLEGRVVLVTGGARRIGQAIALALARRRAHVVISYRTSAREARATLRAIQNLGSEGLAVQADLSRGSAVQRVMDRIARRFGRLDVLVNSASNFLRSPFETLTERGWDEALDTNLKGPFLCALYASRLMRRHGGGKIINLADWAGVRPYRDYLPYCVSKAGVIGLTKALAKELAPGIHVNAIAPGPSLPPARMSAAARKRVATRVPLKRWGGPQDIANAVLFLIEGTDFMTGSVIFVDGGQLIA
ncbi:MAG: SDR family oxidoreductase [Candidatus Omnitrophica bacterium]|nr:SDR family oxidoreductase [Candidatus Omnitrophota bacterium]MBI3083642.1 SDR family oxidoreductase [Candidatus Omnitrophota bacterium]